MDWSTTSPDDQQFRAAMMFHKDAFVYAEAQGVRSQFQYLQQFLGTLYTADTIYGVSEIRDNAAMAIIVDA